MMTKEKIEKIDSWFVENEAMVCYDKEHRYLGSINIKEILDVKRDDLRLLLLPILLRYRDKRREIREKR